MKQLKTLMVVTVMLALAAFTVRAQYSPKPLTLDSGSTQTVLAGGTTNFAAGNVIYCGKQASVPVSIAFKMDGAGTGAQTLVFARSVDGSKYESLAAKRTTVGIAATGATESITVTNIPTYGAAYIKLVSWANGETAGSGVNATNIVLKWGEKIGAP